MSAIIARDGRRFNSLWGGRHGDTQDIVGDCRLDSTSRKGHIPAATKDQDNGVISKIFSWWNEATLGALYDIKRRSDLVGEDAYGNRYFEDRKPSIGGRHRRYVVYRGLAEPSKVPADWHGWLHHTLKLPPTEAPLKRKPWELDHKPNMTGTVFAEKPKGALSENAERAQNTADYEAWSPDA